MKNKDRVERVERFLLGSKEKNQEGYYGVHVQGRISVILLYVNLISLNLPGRGGGGDKTPYHLLDPGIKILNMF